MILSKYQIKWTLAIFHPWDCPKEWAKFKRLYKKNFCTNNTINKNRITIWYLEKERIEWIKENLPFKCSVKFIEITDKQFSEHSIFNGKKLNGRL